jgi:hypothetical protein
MVAESIAGVVFVAELCGDVSIFLVDWWFLQELMRLGGFMFGIWCWP